MILLFKLDTQIILLKFTNLPHGFFFFAYSFLFWFYCYAYCRHHHERISIYNLSHYFHNLSSSNLKLLNKIQNGMALLCYAYVEHFLLRNKLYRKSLIIIVRFILKMKHCSYFFATVKNFST